jgi:farnesyl-diphosphate farnesyltransferase
MSQTQDMTGDELQDRLLPGVSRTFALTIPELPPSLRRSVTNAYLLCRIADTIEDDVALDADAKETFHDQFVAAVEGRGDAEAFAQALYPRLSPQTPQAERDLIREVPAVIAVTQSLDRPQRQALENCIRVMCSGMPDFQQGKSLSGLRTVSELERYCYYVAGVVGEMLTELFCDHRPEIAQHRKRLMPLAVSFGQGLQMTNILKDFWEDRDSQTCWLPSEVFERHGIDLADADSDEFQPAFRKGITELIGIAHRCLRDAMDYVRLIPTNEVGIRRFCIWAIGLAVLTLQNIRKRPEYRSGTQVKVSRSAVKATVISSNLLARSNAALSMLFNAVASGLPGDLDVEGSRAGSQAR